MAVPPRAHRRRASAQPGHGPAAGAYAVRPAAPAQAGTDQAVAVDVDVRLLPEVALEVRGLHELVAVEQGLQRRLELIQVLMQGEKKASWD